MAGNPSDEETKFWIKVGLYATALALGILTKFAELLKEKDMTWKDFMLHTLEPLSVSFVVLSVMYFSGAGWISLPASVVCGKYGKEIWSIVYKTFKGVLKNILEGMK